MDFFKCKAKRKVLVFGSGKLLFLALVFLLYLVSSVSLSLH